MIEHVHFGHGASTYLTDDAHEHLLCEQCGRVIEVPEEAFAPLTHGLATSYGFRIRPRHFAIMGICAQLSGPRRQHLGEKVVLRLEVSVHGAEGHVGLKLPIPLVVRRRCHRHRLQVRYALVRLAVWRWSERAIKRPGMDERPVGLAVMVGRGRPPWAGDAQLRAGPGHQGPRRPRLV